MKTLDQIIMDGIKETDWTYCKAEYAPNAGCKIGMPEECTPDGTIRLDVETCYIVVGKLCDGEVSTHADMMFLDDGNFYWYDNLWDDDDCVEQEKSCGHFIEPIAWIAYQNVPERTICFPVPPYNKDAVPKPYEE